MSDLKDFKPDISSYIRLPPLGIRNAVIEECAARIEREPHSIAPCFAEIVRSLKS